MLMLMIMQMIMLMLMVFLDALVSPVSPWTLRALDQLVRYLHLSVGLVLGGQHCILGGKLVCSTKGICSTDVFQMGFF
jgi:hypothetical protein